MRPLHKLYDSLHGFISFNDWERSLIESPPFQRLHYIRQLGSAYLVYPGAVHTRFEHSLGVLELASQMLSALTQKETLFQELKDFAYWRQMLRFASLAHDLGHLPFSHTAEKEILGPMGHEKWTQTLLQSEALKPLWDEVQAAFAGKEVLKAVVKLSLGPKKCKTPFSAIERVLSEIITGDFFGADRIDYLLRDAKYTGLSYGLFDYHQLIEMLFVTEGEGRGQWRLGIEENGIEASEALLLARHFMFRRIYDYSPIKASAFHLKRFMQKMREITSYLSSVDHYLQFTDNEVLFSLRKALQDPKDPEHKDAAAYLLKQGRFRALPLASHITEREITAFKAQEKIPSDEIFWEFSPKAPKKGRLDCFVRLKSGGLVHASEVSELTLPQGPSGWLYIAAAHYPAALIHFS